MPRPAFEAPPGQGFSPWFWIYFREGNEQFWRASCYGSRLRRIRPRSDAGRRWAENQPLETHWRLVNLTHIPASWTNCGTQTRIAAFEDLPVVGSTLPSYLALGETGPALGPANWPSVFQNGGKQNPQGRARQTNSGQWPLSAQLVRPESWLLPPTRAFSFAFKLRLR